jgi:hypothetical protein
VLSVTDAHSKPLSLRSAERAIDLALEAELAGDYDGALAALASLVETATQPDALAGKERIGAFRASMIERRSAFARHGKVPKAYRAALDSLRPFGFERSERLWANAVRDVPGLGRLAPKVAIELELVKGPLDRGAAVERLSKLFARHGLVATPKADARFIVRINVDSTDVESGFGGVRVRVEASAVVKDQRHPGHSAGSISKRREERRRKEDEARRFAVVRALDDIGRGAVMSVRARVLEDAAPPT